MDGGGSQILLVLALLLVGGKVAGRLGQAVGLPTAVGKIVLGLLLGPAVLHMVALDSTLRVFSQVGVLVLMFMAGLETDTVMMRRVGGAAFAVALGGVVLPFAGGIGLGILMHLASVESLFLAAMLTATSVSISAQTLRELGQLQSKEGTMILAAAVIDDVMGAVILAFVFAISGHGAATPAIGRMVLFFACAFIAGRWLIRPGVHRIAQYLSVEGELTLVLGVALVYGWAAERVGGVAAITGTYLVGALFAESHLGGRILSGVNWLGYAFFVPLFFVAVGLQADITSLREQPGMVMALLAIAIAGKVAGCYLAGRAARLTHMEATRVGVGMMSRGEIALVIAAAALDAGAIDGSLFSATVVIAVATSVLTPIALRLTFRGAPRARAEAVETVAFV